MTDLAWWGGSILTAFALLVLGLKVIRYLDGALRVVRRELTNNGGSSMKDGIDVLREGQKEHRRLLAALAEREEKNGDEILKIWKHLAATDRHRDAADRQLAHARKDSS